MFIYLTTLVLSVLLCMAVESRVELVGRQQKIRTGLWLFVLILLSVVVGWRNGVGKYWLAGVF